MRYPWLEKWESDTYGSTPSGKPVYPILITTPTPNANNPSICQDDSEDWSRETSRMGSVYSNAYIMLSATGSPSSTSGLSIFSPNRPAPIYSPFEYTTTNGIKGTLHAFSSSRETAAKPSWAGDNAMLKNEPLSQRGWALQERWLAPRVLHFGAEQMFFECYCSFLSEQGFYLPGRGDTLFPTTACTSSSHTHPSSPDKPIPDTPMQQWHAVLDAYSRRALTRPSDKLPALSGLARTYASLIPSPSTYLAGFWYKTLLQDLIWQAVGTTTSPAVYRAPSWSWAAIDGPFGLFSPGSGVGFDKGEWTALAKIHATSITLKSNQNPFGEVKDGYLDISAPLERLYPSPEQREGEGDVFPNRQKGALAQTKEKLEGDMQPTYTCFDTPTHTERARGRELWAAVLWKHVRPGEMEREAAYHAVIVARVEGREGNVYERLGKVPFSAKDLGECKWMDDAELVERFTLV